MEGVGFPVLVASDVLALVASRSAILSSELSESVCKVKDLLLPSDMETTAYPACIIMSGLPGSGKSYLSERVAQRLPAVVIESDRVRKVLYPQPTYTAQESATVHDTCREIIGWLLKEGVRVVFDATNLVEFQRETLFHLVERSGAQLLIVRVVAPEEVIRSRLEHRHIKADTASDADWTVYRRMSQREQKIRRAHLCIDTSQDIEVGVRRILRAIRSSASD